MTQRLFGRVLVANRSEIAVRVLRGLRELGIEGVAVYSDADDNALWTRTADRAVHLGPSEPARSYLDIDRILGVARDTECEAVHPGYGFLAENADFARACEAEGITFIGPTPEAMETLGSKRTAKQAAIDAGVPCVPGFDGHGASDDAMLSGARAIGFPLLVKASAGGGGRGMRLVEREADFAEALIAGRREAAQSFGDDAMLLEKYLRPSRHVEVQIFGDGEGRAIALGERECSVQRRHQKLLEESPSPIVDSELRQRLERAAVELARAVRYRNAGTVEFLVDAAGAFYFLEVNTRLQVEHPVTELVTGLDLVHIQVALAAGTPLSDVVPDKRVLRGWALEARVCAEDPSQGFLPASGEIRVCVEPGGPGVRVDSGFECGDVVPVHYDSMLAKVIVHAPNRRACIARMLSALRSSAWLGIPTNVDFLCDVLSHAAFGRGDLRTDFLDIHTDILAAAAAPPDRAVLAAALAGGFARPDRAATRASNGDDASPWHTGDGFRLLGGRR